jgi:butyrate kinase
MENLNILVINPGSTSTKIAYYKNLSSIFQKTISHRSDELKKFPKVFDQKDFRLNLILDELKNVNIHLSDINAVIGRGGLLNPIPSGVYLVNTKMIRDLTIGVQGEHASNLGGIIAHSIASQIDNCLALIADPVVVDELQDVARITGHPMFIRKSIFHALNQKAVARVFAKSVNINYENLNLIVAHLGGGISVGTHQKGKVIDVNQALDGEGPFSPERSGTLPVGDLINICYSGKYTRNEMQRMVVGNGGLNAYFGTNDAREVEKLATEGNSQANLILEAMAYQVVKSIGAAAAVLKGNIDAILLTGGMAHSKIITNYISEHISFLAPVKIYPGEDEMEALASNAFMALTQDTELKEY